MAEGNPTVRDPKDGDDKLHDVCVAYHDKDEYRIKKHILPYLHEAGITFILLGENEGQSGDKFAIAKTQIMQCKSTLLIFSKEGAKNMNFSFEIFVTLEKSIKLNEMRLIVLRLDDVKSEDIPKIPFLEHASQHYVLDNNMHETCMGHLVGKIKGKHAQQIYYLLKTHYHIFLLIDT